MASPPPSNPGSAAPNSEHSRTAGGSKTQILSPGAAAAEAKATARKEMERRAAAAVAAAREATMFFERYEKAELQEALTRRASDWLLSIWDGSCKHSTEMSDGLAPGLPKPESGAGLQSTSVASVQSAAAQPDPCSILLVEHSLQWEPLQLRELQQLIRELVTGIYVFNQLPSVQFDALPDGRSSVRMPHAYQDTRLGQVMVAVAYQAQCFLCGSHFAADKRPKFAERWRELRSSQRRGSGDASMTAEERQRMTAAQDEFGMRVLADEAAFGDAYLQPSYDDLQRLVGHEYDAEAVATAARQLAAGEGRAVWREALQLASLQVLLVPKAARAHRDMLMVDADWTLASSCRLPAAGMQRDARHRLQALVQEQRRFAAELLLREPELRVQLRLLRFATCAAAWLTTLRKQFLVPDVTTFLPAVPSEQLTTDRELPPLFIAKPAPCAPMASRLDYVTAGGGGLGIVKTALRAEELAPSISAAYEYIHELARECRTEELFASSVTPCAGKQYYVLGISLEKYYSTAPKIPRWIHALYSEMNSLVGRVGLVTEQRAQDQFKRHFGEKRAAKLKQISLGLVASAERGLAAVFESFSKRCAESRVKQVDPISGLSLMHRAALNDRAEIVSILLRMSCEIDQVSEEESGSKGSTALHYAALCGHLDTMSALLMHGARTNVFNDGGLAPVHLAAMANCGHAVELLVKRDDHQLELATQDGMRSTPLLLAVECGCLDTVRLLASLGADTQASNADQQNAVRLAARYRRVTVMQFFTEDAQCLAQFNSWEILAVMLASSGGGEEASWALSVLIPLSVASKHNLTMIIQAGIIKVLVKLMASPKTEQQAIHVVRLIGRDEEIQRVFVESSGIPALVSLLGRRTPATNCHAAVVMADLLSSDVERQADVAQAKAIPALVKLLHSAEEHTLLCALGTLALAVGQQNSANQCEVRECGGFAKVVALLSDEHVAASHRLFEAACELIVCLCSGCADNQLELVKANGTGPLLGLIQYEQYVNVQTSAASAIRAVALDNPITQEVIRHQGGVEPMKRLMKHRGVEVKVFAATAVWAVAGAKLVGRQLVASQIGIDQLIMLCELQNELLEIVGTEALCALAHGAKSNQEAIAAAGGVLPVVRLLRPIANSSEAVLMRAVEAIGVLCIGPAMCPNKSIQDSVTKASGVDLLVQIALKPNASDLLKAMSVWALSCVTLANANSRQILASSGFSIEMLLDMWYWASTSHRDLQRKSRATQRQRKVADVNPPTADEVQEQVVEVGEQGRVDKTTQTVHLYCGRALTGFTFGNRRVQKGVGDMGGLEYTDFTPFMDSADPALQAYFDFQVVVVAPILKGANPIRLAVSAITHLVELLDDEDDEVQMLAADCLASLAHTRAGIPATIVQAGGLDALLKNLASPIVSVMDSAAAALGYLSFDPTARRVLFKACRDLPFLVRKLFLRTSKISPDFVELWEDAKGVGIPALSLETNGGVALVYSSLEEQPDFNRRSKLETQVYSSLATPPGSRAGQASQSVSRPMRRSAAHPSPWYQAMQRTAERVRGVTLAEQSHLRQSLSMDSAGTLSWKLRE